MNKNTKKFENKKYIKTYFANELNEAIDGMSNSEMVEVLKELEGTRYWVAIMKYTQDRMLIAHSTLCSIDPIKFPADIARAQGIISGLMDTQSAINSIKETIKQQEEKIHSRNDSTSPVDETDDYSPNY